MNGSGRLRVFAVFALVLMFVGHACAGISVRPHRVDEWVSYGETRSIDITLANPGDAAKQINVSLAGVKTLTDGSPVWLNADGSDAEGDVYAYASIGEWVTVEPSSVILPPGGEAMVRLQVTVPASPGEGEMAGRVGALWFDVADRGDDGALFDSVVRFITFLLFRFDDDRQAAGELTPLAPRQEASGDIVLPVLLTNTGNVHLTPAGGVTVRDARSGRIVAELYLSEGTSLPQCPRSYGAVWVGGGVQDGEYSAEFAVTFGDMLPEQRAEVRFSVQDGLLVPGGA